MASRRERDAIADEKAKEDIRRKELAERCRRQLLSLNCERPESSRGRVDQLLEWRRKAERKRAHDKRKICRDREPLSVHQIRRPLSSDADSKKEETLAELRARDKENRKHLDLLRRSKSNLDRIKPESRAKRDVMADLKEKNLEMKRQLAAKLATRTPIHQRGGKREKTDFEKPKHASTARPSSATRPKPKSIAVPARPSSAKVDRPRTAEKPTNAAKISSKYSKPSSPATSERDEITRLRQEVEDLKRLITEMKKNPNCKSQEVICDPEEPRDMTDPTLEGTRELLENAYKSFEKMEAMCPDFLNSDIKRAAKVLIGLAAGIVPGSPYHELYQTALAEKMASGHDTKRVNPEHIVLRPGDIDPDATTVVNVTGHGETHEPTTRGDYSVKVVHARHAPYSLQNINSLTDAEEEIRIPSSPEEDEDPMTSEVRSMLESLRPPKTPKDEVIDLLGEIRRPQRKRGAPRGRPVSPLRDYELEEDCLVDIKPKSPQKISEPDKKRRQKEIERKTKAELAKIRREARAKAGLDCSDDEILFDDECEEKTPPQEICLGPYGAELVQNVLPRSRYARELGLDSEGEGVELCLGSRY